jgi:membrane fusion protein (multidrug efflux system)
VHRTRLRDTIRAGRTALLVLTVAALSACGGDEAAADKQPPAPPPAQVVVAKVETKDVPVMRVYVARTEAKDTVEVQARVEAILKKMHFEEGRRVEKGQLLFELDPQTFQANVDSAQADIAKAEADLRLAEEQVSVRAAEAALVQAKASLRKAQQDVARLRPLAEEDAVPRQDLDTAIAAEEVAAAEVVAKEAELENSKIMEDVGKLQAEALLARARAALTLAKLDLSYCRIESPIDGLIGRTKVSEGNLVGRGEATELATVSLIDPMWVTFSISEEEYLNFRRQARARGDEGEGQTPLDLILADGSTFEHRGRIITAERAVDLETGTLQLVAEFPNAKGELRPGQFGRIRLAVELLEGAVLVPQKAVTESQGVKGVLVVGEGNKVALKTIQVSERHEGSFVVIEGLSGGETIVVEGLQKARPGSVVEPRAAAASTEPVEEEAQAPESGE